MLFILVDMAVLWFLLNFVSGESWDDRKGKVLSITVIIALAGAGIGRFLAPIYTLGVYVLVAGLLLKFLAELSWQKAFQIMGAFLVYKIVVVFVLVFIVSSAEPVGLERTRPAKQHTPEVSDEDVDRIVKRDYPHRDIDSIHQLIAKVDVREKARVVLACLKNAAGNTEGLAKELKEAPGYWREIISAAEYPYAGETGRERLQNLSEAERQKVYDKDWAQYEDWLNRDTKRD